LTPSLTSIGDLLAVVFVGAFASAWVAAGSLRISYAGFQIAFAFLLCAVQGAGPSFDLVTARDRIIGVLFGILVVYLVFATIWPVSVAKRIDRGIGDMMRRMAASLTAGSRPSRGSDTSELQQMLGGVEEDIKVARYEPLSTRPPNEWLERRRQAVEEIGALLGMAWLALDDSPSLAAATGARLNPPDPEQLPPGGELAAQSAPPTEGPEPAQQPFRDLIERRLDALEKIAYAGLGTRDRWEDHAPP
ncbi:MAG: FUSC family protein, partial [Methylocystis sp.]